jgi:hypothetical protein
MALAQYLLVATTPWPSSFFAAIRAYAICFLVTLRSIICALRSRARVHAHWHTFVLTVENVVIVGMGFADDEAGIGDGGRSMCVALGLGLGLGPGLMRRRRNRMEKKRLRARSQMVRRCRERRRRSASMIILPIEYRVGSNLGGSLSLRVWYGWVRTVRYAYVRLRGLEKSQKVIGCGGSDFDWTSQPRD